MTSEQLAFQIIIQARKKNNPDLVSAIYSVQMEILAELIKFMEQYRENERKAKEIKQQGEQNEL